MNQSYPQPAIWTAFRRFALMKENLQHKCDHELRRFKSILTSFLYRRFSRTVSYSICLEVRAGLQPGQVDG